MRASRAESRAGVTVAQSVLEIPRGAAGFIAVVGAVGYGAAGAAIGGAGHASAVFIKHSPTGTQLVLADSRGGVQVRVGHASGAIGAAHTH